MMATTTTENEIRQLAVEKFHAVDAAISRMEARDYAGCVDAGTWYVLSVRQHLGGEWEVIGRRRSRAELLTMLAHAAV